MRRLASIAIAGSLLATTALTAAPAGAAPKISVKVVAGHLDSPKKLVFHDGQLYVIESGSGGTAAAHCVTGPIIGGPGTTKYCEGNTGAVAVITAKGARVEMRLPSVLEQDSREAFGPSAIAFSARGPAILFQDALVNARGRTAVAAPAKAAFGTLVLPGGRLAPIARFAAAHPQDKATLGGLGETTYDSDPYAVIAYRGGWVVADAAANDLLRVTAGGRVSLITRFPTVAETVPAGVLGPVAVTVHAQAVPTALAVGPDGAIYVGFLRGVPSLPGTADIYRVVAGHEPTIWTRGLTSVTAIAFDARGRLLATEYNTAGLLAPPTVPGALVRISPDGRRVATMPVPGLFAPTGVAVGPDGAVYVTNRGTGLSSSGKPGEVLEVTGLG